MIYIYILRNKISSPLRGRKLSEETKEKMRLAYRRRLYCEQRDVA